MAYARLIRINPAKREVLPMAVDITPRKMQQLLKSEKLVTRELVRIEGVGVTQCARAWRTPAQRRQEPRWQFGALEPIEGLAFLFGLNAAGRAAECPLEKDFVVRNMIWLPSAAEAEKSAQAAQEALARIGGMNDGAVPRD